MLFFHYNIVIVAIVDIVVDPIIPYDVVDAHVHDSAFVVALDVALDVADVAASVGVGADACVVFCC